MRRMQQKRRFVASLMIYMLGELIVAHPLLAATGCTVRASTLDERFGLLPLGASIKDSANNSQLKPCPSTTGQCIYVDEIGIVYESDDHVVIDSKSFDLPVGKEGKFPLGLTSHDAIADFMRKILPEDDAEASIFKNGTDKILVLSAPCHANSKGIVFQIIAVFTDEGQLSGVSIANSSNVQKMLEFRNELSRRNK